MLSIHRRIKIDPEEVLNEPSNKKTQDRFHFIIYFNYNY